MNSECGFVARAAATTKIRTLCPVKRSYRRPRAKGKTTSDCNKGFLRDASDANARATGEEARKG